MNEGIKDKIVLSSAPPPLDSVLLLLVILGVFSFYLPSWASLDEVATVDTFTRRLFPKHVSLEQLAIARLLLATTIWVVTIHMACFSNGWHQTTTYMKGSKLIATPNHVVGIKTLFPFTSVSWILLGFSFTLSGYIAMHSARTPDSPIPQPILRAALIVWEVAAPFTFLVACVIRYAIWPTVLKNGDTTNLKSIRNIFMHNLNVLFALSETALLGGVPLYWSHMSLAPLVGIFYVIFSWNMTCSWNDPRKYGPQFIYFFFDTTLPGYTHSKVLVILLTVLLLFYAIFASASWMLSFAKGYGWPVHLVFVGVFSSITMRFRD